MNRIHLACTAMSIAWLCGSAHASDTISYAPKAAWVTDHPAPPDDPAKDKGPISLLTLDTQVRQEGATEQRYSHYSERINTAQGLQAGTIALAWEPDIQDLIVHKIVIHRDGKTIDVLGEGQKLTILRRERNLEIATLDGMKTATLFPAGLQVGDVLEVATTTVTKNPVLGDHAEAFFGPVNYPADRVDFTITWPATKTMRLSASKEMPAWKRGSKDGFDTASIELDDVQPIAPPDGAPPRYSMIRIAEASDYASWADVAHLFAPLFAKASPIPATGPLREALDAIRKKTSDPKARAQAALDLVENQIRYVALEMGQAGYVPAAAADTWSRRYGDCKGKTALLLGLLHELGIDAQPVLVNSVMGNSLDERLPALLFDHVLVRATIGGKPYWLDGTRTGDTDIDRLQIPDFGWVLPVTTGDAALVKLAPPPFSQPQEDLAIVLDASKGLFAPVPAHITETLRGDVALGMQQAMASLTGETREKALRDYWSGQFDFIKPTRTDFSYDPKTGEGVLTLEGIATLDWKGGYYETDRTGVGYRADFSRMDGPFADAPFAVRYPSYDRTRETIIVPPDFPTGTFEKSSDVDETVAGIAYKRQVTRDKNRIAIVTSSKSIEPEFPASQAPAAQKRLRELNDEALYIRIPAGYSPSGSDVTALSADDQSVDKLLSAGNILLDAGKYDDALTQFTRATDKDPDNQLAWTDRGLAEAWLKQFAKASVSLDRAASLGSMTRYIHHGRGLVAESQGKPEEAVKEYSAALAEAPDDEFALDHKAQMELRLNDAPKALADAKKLLSLDPASGDGFTAEFYAELGMGDRSGAQATLKAMLAKLPDSPDRRRVAAGMYGSLGQKEEARRLLAGSDVDNDAGTALMRAQTRSETDTTGKNKDLDRAVALAPDTAEPYFARATFRRGQSDFPDALSDIDKALSIEGQNPNFYLLKANILNDMGRRDDVIGVARQVASAIPKDGYGHVVAAKIYAHFDMRKEALAEIDDALSVRPEAYIYINRADVMDPDDIEGRMAEVDKALVLEPDMVNAFEYKAKLYERAHDYAAALAMLNRIIADHPGDRADYLIERGVDEWKNGDVAAAKADFEVKKKAAKEPSDLYDLCSAQVSADIALDDALQNCNGALSAAPGKLGYLNERGMAYLRLHRFRDAIDDFDAALAKSAHLPFSLLGRAIAEANIGETEKARADYKEGNQRNPSILHRLKDENFQIPKELTEQAG